ncbi:PREDICTED: fibrous sheath-interacting protein 1 isoform X1 [Poecilia mexicana]|uniref:fibrous sheath-interacting protein 1 isoform X1 n=1 Tax=Poecilia mexicana TaxID=48701 RepID=UPI00072DB7D4|nr:PREDICTED: fibrous sheath-interacting protein 1 isoform X1 [Poecilia mexicana]
MFASVVTDRIQGEETVDNGLLQLLYSIFIVSESVHNAMEIIKGSLDNISRPASTEQTDNRFCPAAPFELLVLSNDSADFQQNGSGEMEHPNRGTGPGKDPVENTGDENEDSKLQRAFEEMRRLDAILSAEIFKEKEIQCQRKELQAKMWQELQRKPDRYSECAHEALNTKLFLALEAHTCTKEEDHYAPLFETQVPDCEHDGDDQGLEQADMPPCSLTSSFGGSANNEGLWFVESNSKTSKTKNKQKDFVQRNIELASDVGRVRLTRAEKERLAELFQEKNEEEEDRARTSGTDSEEAVWATSVSAGQGYTPEPSELEHLMELDAKICLLLPAEELHSLQSSNTDLSVFQEVPVKYMEVVVGTWQKGLGSKVGWKQDWDRQPGEKVLQDIKERRELETRLQEIQRQLEMLGVGQEMTNESADLTEEQLLCLLDECERTESWSQVYPRNKTAPSGP